MNKLSWLFVLTMATLFILVPSPALQAQSEIDTGYYYRLTNSQMGPGRALDTYSNGDNKPFMAKTGNVTGQSWKLTPLPGGYYRLTNSYLGDSRALDTYGSGENKPFMGKTGNFSGQKWKLTPKGNGYLLTNAFLGTKKFLGAQGDSPEMEYASSEVTLPSQVWILTKLKRWDVSDQGTLSAR